VAHRAVACTEIPVVVDQSHETGFRKGTRETLEPMLLHAGIAMRHRNGGTGVASRFWDKQPAAQALVALDREFHVPTLNHDVFS